MTDAEIFALYERLYFHEIERRAAIDSRANLPLALLLGQAGLLAFLVDKVLAETQSWQMLLFWSLFVISLLGTAVAGWFGIHGLIRFTDKLLPTASATEKYRQELMELYSPYDDADILVQKALRTYLFEYYMALSSTNAVNNDSRSYDLFRAVVAVSVAIVLGLLAYVVLIVS
jgi:hypothetical protein